MTRPVCKACNKNPAAANYWRNGVRHYRSRCEICIRLGKQLRAPVPRWKNSGYKKKMTCDMCGFKCTYASQIVVCHIDGNLNNSELINLRSICLCCLEVVKRRQVIWKIGDIEEDHQSSHISHPKTHHY